MKQIKISVGDNRKSINWRTVSLTWEAFADKCSTPVKGVDTLNEYMGFPKAKQDRLKDVGGFVGGELDGRRKAVNLKGRDLISLDLDNIPRGGTNTVIEAVKALNVKALIYSTRKHSAFKPRLRVIVPLDKTAAPDTYEPIARRLAERIGLDYTDPTTFEPIRLMYWPSCCADSEYVYEVLEGDFCSADGVLATYTDWRDIREWPQVKGAGAIETRRLDKAEDPTEKNGLVGAFCREFTIKSAMEEFIPHAYTATEDPNRFTFSSGSTCGGAIVYDDKFLYSHHATDPCSDTLVNAWDLVRLHLFNHLDDAFEPKEGTKGPDYPSYKAMQKLASRNDAVSLRMTQEKLEHAQEVFASSNCESVIADSSTAINADLNDSAWLSKLDRNDKGVTANTINNAVLVLQNDPLIKDKLVNDEFLNKALVKGSLPWNNSDSVREWDNIDDANCYNYMELKYGISGRERVDNAITIVGGGNTVNIVADYFKGLVWDGVPRIDTLLHDYLGAEKNEYTAAVMRKTLCAAVTRAVTGETKFDYMPILVGKQGIGKSTFLALLGKDWFSDSLTTFSGKDAAELLQGVLINEVGELSAMYKQTVEEMKQFLSKTADYYRPAYGKRSVNHPRRCVFFGTTNTNEILKDATGNRRFWPVDLGIYTPTKNVWNELPDEVDLIWAEAYTCFILGEKLYLTPELEEMAKEQQDVHRFESPLADTIKEFLSTPIPENWYDLSLQVRRGYINGEMPTGADCRPRDRVNANVIWEECLGGSVKDLKWSKKNEINDILRSLPGWEEKSTVRIGNKRCRGFITKDVNNDVAT